MMLWEPENFCTKEFGGQFFITFGLYSAIWYSRVLDMLQYEGIQKYISSETTQFPSANIF